MIFNDLKFGEVFGLNGGLYHRINTDAHPELLTTFNGINALGFGDGVLYVISPETDVQQFPFGEFDTHDPLVSELPILNTGSSVKVDTSRIGLLEMYNSDNKRSHRWKYDRRTGEVYRNEGVDHQGIPQYMHLANQVANVSQQHIIQFHNGDKRDYRRENLDVVGVHYHGVQDYPKNKKNPFRAYYPKTAQSLGYYRDRDTTAMAYDLFVVGTSARAPLNFADRLEEYELAIANRTNDTIPPDNYTEILTKIEKYLP